MSFDGFSVECTPPADDEEPDYWSNNDGSLDIPQHEPQVLLDVDAHPDDDFAAYQLDGYPTTAVVAKDEGFEPRDTTIVPPEWDGDVIPGDGLDDSASVAIVTCQAPPLDVKDNLADTIDSNRTAGAYTTTNLIDGTVLSPSDKPAPETVQVGQSPEPTAGPISSLVQLEQPAVDENIPDKIEPPHTDESAGQTDDAESASPGVLNTVEGLREFIQTPEMSGRLRANFAQRMQHTINNCNDSSLSPVEIDEQGFSQAYDPDLPTIAVDVVDSFDGKELVGQVSRIGDAQANIVYVMTAAGDAGIVGTSDGRRMLRIKAGMIVLPSGQVVYGTFPGPVHADVFETVDKALLEQCAAHNMPTFGDITMRPAFIDKTRLAEVVKSDAVLLPTRYSESDFLASNDVSGLVIKPSKRSCGMGVFLTDDTTEPAQARAIYRFLQDHGYEPIVEQRILSFPFLDPNTHERLDWNVRALIDHGKLLGMYVRVGPWGKPVNLSRGAKAIPLEDIARYVQDETTAKLIIERLTAAASALAADNQTGLIGADMTIDESLSLQPPLFELNCDHVGGMQTIVRLAQTMGAKTDLPRRLLDHWLQRIGHQAEPTDPHWIETSLLPSFTALVAQTAAFQDFDPVACLEPSALPWGVEEERGGVYYSALSIRAMLWQQGRQDQVTAIDRLLTDLFPLEMQKDMPYFLDNCIESKRFVSLLQDFEKIHPKELMWTLLLADLLMSRYNLPELRKAYDHAIATNLYDAEADFQGTVADAVRSIFMGYDIFPKDKKIELYSLATDACLRYCDSGIDAALALLDRAGDDPTIEPALACIRFTTLLGARRYGQALALWERYSDDMRVGAFMLNFVLQPHNEVLGKDIAGLTTLCSVLFSKGIALDALHAVIDYARDVGFSTVLDDLLGEIGRTMPIMGSYKHAQWFTQTLRSIIIDEPNQEAPLPPAPPEDSADIVKYGWLLQKLYRGSNQGVDSTIYYLLNKDILWADVAEMSNAFRQMTAP